jgi:hypothetical protein
MSILIVRLKPCVRCALTAALLACASSSSLAATDEIGRLFYTPTQRAQLETARAHSLRAGSSRNTRTADENNPPLRFDGIVTRSDGKTTRWVDGKAQVGPSSVSGLKPGQIRADGKIYEPYQVLRPTPADSLDSGTKETAP